MATKQRQARTAKFREYQFHIDAYSPATFPMKRLAEYLRDLAILFGESEYVHFNRLQEGSTSTVIRVEKEAEPKVRERLRSIKRKNAPIELMRVAEAIDERAREDNATASVIDPVESNLLFFPGCERPVEPEYGPLNESGTLDGIPIAIGGELDLVPVHLLGRDNEKHYCRASRPDAKQIAPYLFTTLIRVEGVGKWLRRANGEWKMLSFTIKSFRELEDISLSDSIERLRAIPAEWKKLDDPLAELKRMRER
jgi:hypothetical protein